MIERYTDPELAASIPKWIPCKERLPGTKEYVLVTYRNGTIDKDFYDGEQWQYEDGMGDVMAWMLLPAPYKSS